MIAGSVFGVGLVGAQDSTNPASSLVQKIAQRFNLNPSDVQKVFDEEHEERHQKMQEKMEQRLSQAVTDGKITESQKQAIINKFAEMKNNKPDPEHFKNMTEEQRHQEMEQKKAELETWASQNGLSLDTLHELMGPKDGMFHMGFRKFGDGFKNPAASPAAQ